MDAAGTGDGGSAGEHGFAGRRKIPHSDEDAGRRVFYGGGVFKEVKAPKRLVYTWDWEKDGSGAEFGEVEGNPSLITVEFLKRRERTELVLTHSRFATVESRDNHARGWGKIVESLARFVEKV